MKTFLIEPRDPLIVRDGRPIGGDAAIETLPFPFPSTTAGAVRTRMASPNGEFLFPNQDVQLKELLTIPVAGPILAELGAHSEQPKQFLFPAPRDALVFPKEGDDKGNATKIEVQRLRPGDLEPKCHMDSLGDKKLRPICAEGKTERTDKPFAKAPMFWNEVPFLDWLKTGGGGLGPFAPPCLGMASLPTETRVHVVIQPGERVSEDGGLFQTKGLRFAQGKFGQTRPFALSVRMQPTTVDGHALDLRDELAPLGGERRLARWRASASGWPEIPPEVIMSIRTRKTARVVLLTPAMFSRGALPDWENRWPLGGEVTVTVEGACVGRPVIVSGWDMRYGKGGEKPTRRLAPAGSVYFVRLSGSDDAVEKWVRATWLQCVSDVPQDCLDGFGLAMVGVWEEGT